MSVKMVLSGNVSYLAGVEGHRVSAGRVLRNRRNRWKGNAGRVLGDCRDRDFRQSRAWADAM